MVKILYLNPLKDVPYLGLTNHALNVFSRFPKKDFEFYAFFSNPDFETGCIKRLKEHAGLVAHMVFGVVAMWKIRPDVLYGTGSMSELPFFLFKPLRSKYMIGWHGPLNKEWMLSIANYSLRAKIGYYVARFLLRGASVFFCDSEFIASSLRKSFPKKEIVITRNGVDTNLFNPNKNDPKWLVEFLKLNQPKPVAVFVSHLIKRKRPDLIVALAESLPNIQFVIVGREGYFRKTDVDRWLEKNSNLNWFPVLDRENMAKLFASSSVLVFPTLDEPFGFTTIEAMASGLPVVATRSGATPELVRDGVDGFLVNRDSNELSEFIDKVKELCDTNQTQLRARIRSDARERAISLFNWEYVSEVHFQIFKRFIQHSK